MKFGVKRLLLLLVPAAIAACDGGPSALGPGDRTLLDLDDRPVSPRSLARVAGSAAVFVFTRTDCSISNRYAPEMRRLADAFSASGVRFALVFPDPDATGDEIRRHLSEFGYDLLALRDPDHAFAAATGAVTTPEAVVLDATGRLLYRGRIDDRWESFGQLRAEPTRRDLEEVLSELAAGGRPSFRATRAVGCRIEDLS